MDRIERVALALIAEADAPVNASDLYAAGYELREGALTKDVHGFRISYEQFGPMFRFTSVRMIPRSISSKYGDHLVDSFERPPYVAFQQ